MGKTGETFLVGPDGLMRSDSRLFLQNPEQFKRDVVEGGHAARRGRGVDPADGTTLVQPVATEATRAGPARTARHADHRATISGTRRCRPTPRSTCHGLHWSIIAKIDTSEAFAPVSTFTRTLVLSTAVIIFVVCLAAMLLARLFVRPIRRLEAGAQRISAGDYDVSRPGAVARRIRRSDSGVQRHEPQPGDQGRAARRAA